MKKLFPAALDGQSASYAAMATTLLVLLMFIGSPLHAGDEATDAGTDRVTTLAQADQVADQATGEEVLEEVVVVGTQIKGAAISEALAVTSIDAQEIEASGISSAQELLDYLPEQGQNFQTEAANAYNYNAVRGDVGAFNLRNMGTGNTLVLLNGRRLVQTAGYQTERVGG
ncbi:MAG: Plug domain-containing protein, partial [Lysobacterales bacterium]